MSSEAMIEQRLSALEAGLAEVRRSLSKPAPNWLERLIGSQKGEPAFEEVVALGRAFREADRPAQDNE